MIYKYDAHARIQKVFSEGVKLFLVNEEIQIPLKSGHDRPASETPFDTPISPRIILIPIVPDQYFWLNGRISAKQSGTCGQSRAITWEGLERSGAIAPVLRESGTEKVIGYCF